MIEHNRYNPFEVSNETKSQDNEITAMLNASNKALEWETTLETLLISSLRDYVDTGRELTIEMRLALGEHLNKFSQPTKIIELI